MGSLRTEYHAIACNRVPNCVQWGKNGQIAIGTSNSVAITKISDDGMLPMSFVLSGHKDRVNCVRWIESSESDHGQVQDLDQELVSGSTDGALILWRGSVSELALSSVLSGHTGSVTAVDAIAIPTSSDSGFTRRTLIVSASTDSTVRIWERRERKEQGGTEGGGGGAEGELVFVEKQCISFGSGFAVDVAMTVISSGNVPLLAVGGDDCKVHLYTEINGVFTRVQSLSGHEDWIRGLDFTHDDDGDILLASCAQDCFIRVWRISASRLKAAQDTEIQLKKNTFTVFHQVSEQRYAVSLESVLAGHEQWIYAVHWQKPSRNGNGKYHQPLCLLSASMDKTMIIWRFDDQNAMWIDEVRVGEVGGNTLGLYGCQFSPDGEAILSHGYQGAFHLWTKEAPKASGEGQGPSSWSPSEVVSGHYSGVQDLAWNPDGNFLLSVGLDQTTRLHAVWRRDGKESWHEIARPQIHGYDMHCLAMIGPHSFVSGADEKVLRVFEAPTNFLNNLTKISGVDTSSVKALQETKNLAEGASVPALGLSNKAVYQGEGGMPSVDREIHHPSEQYTEIYFAPVALESPPTEDHLLQNTLWPETQKLYGHGNEIFSVAAHPSGNIIASACKAAKPEHAAIILWDTSSWQQRGQLMAHSLTVTQLAFSHDGCFLLGVSRDRTWSLFEEVQSADNPYRLIAHTDKKTSVHSRIIWACSWSHDSQFFATSSRDKKVIVWGKKTSVDEDQGDAGPLGQYGAMSKPLDVGDSATAIDFARQLTTNGSYILAVGVESGSISVHSWHPSQPTAWTCLVSLPKHSGHTMTVKRLSWRPTSRSQPGESSQNRFQLASCSSDGSVRIHMFDSLS
ncbi:elongator complex protein 2 isoform X2 [Strongylocentrotus purpuratus]|uniref:Elongator complex protein 2 n=1 Tax=Strongylocentrotus purpuratus TaxID=7668 RepID=A0A7M7P599_STRPU|nr:elongator complex protein 2 isoform X2 [Strongylocentrotus purpuratus]